MNRKAFRFIVFIVLLFFTCTCMFSGCDGQRGRSSVLSEAWTFDEAGKLLSRTMPDGGKISYDYNETGQLAGVSGRGWKTELAYDGRYNLSSVKNGTCDVQYKYDEFNRPIEINYAIQDAFEKKVSYDYDSSSRISSMKVLAADKTEYQVKYSYDAVGNLLSVDDGSGAIAYSYDIADHKMIRTLPNGIQSEFSFKSGELPDSIEHRAAGGGLIASYAYKYDELDRIVEVVERTPLENKTTGFGWDEKGFLSDITFPDGNLFHYRYDSFGNLESIENSKGLSSFGYDGYGRLTSVDEKVFGYDGNGNLHSIKGAGENLRLDYNSAGQITGMQVLGKTTQWGYDGLGNLVSGGNRSESTFFIPSSLSPAGFPISEHTGTADTFYTYGENLLSATTGGEVSYFLEDGLGAIRHAVDATGKLIGRRDYTPFGQPSFTEGKMPDFRTAGIRLINGTSLNLIGSRAFDTGTGQYLALKQLPPAYPQTGSTEMSTGAADKSGIAVTAANKQPFTWNWTPIRGPATEYALSYWTDLREKAIAEANENNWVLQGLKAGIFDLGAFFSSEQGLKFTFTLATSHIGGLSPYLSAADKFGAANIAAVTTASFMPPENKAVQIAASCVGFLDSGYGLYKGIRNITDAYRLTGEADTLLKEISPVTSSYQSLRLINSSLNKILTANTKLNKGLGNFAQASAGLFPDFAVALSRELYPEGTLAQSQSSSNNPLNIAARPGYWMDGLIPADLLAPSDDSNKYDSIAPFPPPSPPPPQPLQSNPADLPQLKQASFFVSPMEAVEKDLGGIDLDASVEAAGDLDLGEIAGVVWNEEKQCLVLVGDENTGLPSLNISDLAVALKCVFGSQELPWFSLDPADPSNPSGPDLKAVYGGAVKGTAFGQALFDADWLLKEYSFGAARDGAGRTHKISSGVPGYKSVVQRSLEDFQNTAQSYVRFWITCEDAPVYKGEDGIYFGPVKMKVNTEKMYADRSSKTGLASSGGRQDPQAEAFADHFTRYYDEFSLEEPAFGRVKELAKAVAIARWIYEQGIPVDMGWVEECLENTSIDTPETVKALSYSESREETKGDTVITSTISIHGGVDLSVEPSYKPGSGPVPVISEKIAEKLASADQRVFDITHEGKTLKSTVLPITKDGTEKWGKADYGKVEKGGIRYSFSGKKVTGMDDGKGNSADFLYGSDAKLREVTWKLAGGLKASAKREGDVSSLDLFTPANDKITCLYNSSGSLEEMQVNGKTYAKIKLSADSYDVEYDGGYTGRYTMDNKGRIASYMLKNPGREDQVLNFGYDREGMLSDVSGMGGRVHYQFSGGLLKTAQLPAGEAKYSYDGTGRLTGIETSRGEKVAIGYKGEDLSKITVNAGRLEQSWEFEGGRLIAMTDASGKTVKYEYTSDGKPSGVADAYGNKAGYSYDEEGKLKEASLSGGAKIQYRYASDQKSKTNTVKIEIHPAPAPKKETPVRRGRSSLGMPEKYRMPGLLQLAS